MPLPVLHAGAGFPSGPTYSHWRLEPTVGLLVVGLIVAYFLALGPLNRRTPGWETRTATGRQKACFLSGVLTILVALGPPLDDWSGYMLLSAHMVQHLLLTLVAPPLLLLGLPAWLLEPLTRRPLVNRVGYLLTRAPVALLLPGFLFALWHVPSLYEAALERELVHVLEHQVFLLTGLLAWWPLVGPLPAWPRLSPPLQCLYLFAWTIPGGVVGSIITMGSVPLYPHYAAAPRMWGLSLATDQEIAGLLMWVGTNTVYLAIVSVIFFRWAAAEEAKERRGVGRQGSGVRTGAESRVPSAESILLTPDA
jgi:putative membrane protein